MGYHRESGVVTPLDQIDETYSGLLLSGVGEITVEEIAELSAVFREGGEMAAKRLS